MESEKDPYRIQMDRLSFRTKAIVYLSLKSRVLKLFSTSSACIEKLDYAIHYLNKNMAQRKQTIKHSRHFCDTFTSKEYNRWFHSLRYKVFDDVH